MQDRIFGRSVGYLKRRPLLITVLTFHIGAVLLATTLQRDLLVQNIFVDDSFYFYETARHLANGDGLTFDGIHQTNGMQPLWVLLLTPIFWITSDLWFALRLSIILQGVIAGAAVIVLFLAIEELFDRYVATVGTMGWSINTYIASLYLGGHEASLNALVLALILYMLVVCDFDSRRVFAGFGLLCGFAFLVRVDNVILIGVLGGFLVGTWRFRSVRNLLSFGVAASIFPVGFISWNIIYFGHITPISAEVFNQSSTIEAIIYTIGVVIIGIGVGFLVRRTKWFQLEADDKRWIIIPFVVGGIAHLSYYVFLHGTVRPWYIILQTIVIVLLGGVVLWHFFNIFPYQDFGVLNIQQITTLILSVIVLVSFVTMGVTIQGDDDQGGLGKLQYDAALWLRTHSPCDAIIASGSAGVLGYFSERRVVELRGLANSYTFYEKYGGNATEYVVSKHPDFWANYRQNIPVQTLRANGYSRVWNKNVTTQVQTIRDPKTLINPQYYNISFQIWKHDRTKLISNPNC